MSEAPRRKARPDARRNLRRVVVWVIALAALAFVIRAVPIRDRCVDTADPAFASHPKTAPRIPISRAEDGATIVHRPEGDQRIEKGQFDSKRFVCEQGIVTTFQRARISALIAIAAMYLLGTFAWALRWRMLLLLADIRVRLAWVWRVTLEAQAGGVLLPGGVASDALRIAAMVGKGAPTATVVASVMLDRVVGLVTLAALSIGLTIFFGGQSSHEKILLLLAAIPVGFVCGVALLRIPSLAQISILQRGRLATTIKPILVYIGDPRAPRSILAGMAASVIVSGVQLAALRGLIYALGASPPIESEVYVACSLAMIVTAIPTLPGGWGTADAVYVYFLTRAGLDASSALAVCLMYRLLWYVSAAIGAVLFVIRGGRSDDPKLAIKPAEKPSP